MTFKNSKHWVAGITAGMLFAGCSPNNLSSSGTPDPTASKVLVAALGGAEGGIQSSVEYSDDGGHRQLRVEITGGEPGATIDVTINGVVVASVTLDEFGNASLALDSAPDAEGETASPAEFPAVIAGDAVGVDDLVGTFAEEDNGATGDIDDGATGDTDDGATGDTDDGATGDIDDGATGDTDDGAADDLDEGAVGDTDDGATDDNDEGDLDNADDGGVDDVDDGQVGDGS